MYYDPAQSEDNIIIFSLTKFHAAPAAGGRPTFDTRNADGTYANDAILPDHVVPLPVFNGIADVGAMGDDGAKAMVTSLNSMFARTDANKGLITGVGVRLAVGAQHVQLIAAKPAGSYEDKATDADKKTEMKMRAKVISNFVALLANGPFGGAPKVPAEEPSITAFVTKAHGAAHPRAAAGAASRPTVAGVAGSTPYLNIAANDGEGVVQMVREAVLGNAAVNRTPAGEHDPKTNERRMFYNGATTANSDFKISVNNKNFTSNGKDGKPHTVHGHGIMSMHFHGTHGAHIEL